MHKTIILAASAASLIAMSACSKQAATGENNASATTAGATAGGAVNGTWKADLSNVQFDTKPDEYLLQNGTYSCKSCTPAYSLAADGTFHPVDAPYFDSDSVKVVDARTITESSKMRGREVSSATMTVSTDGNTLTGKFTDSTAPGTPVKGEFTETRVGPAPAGAHAISGQWKIAKLSNFNEAALDFTVNVSGDTLQFSTPSGIAYEAKFGGPDVPIKGDIAGTTASVTKTADNDIQVTRKRDGKAVTVITYGVGADGKMHAVSEDKLAGTTMRWTADKQS
jgi:hypothetical protein